MTSLTNGPLKKVVLKWCHELKDLLLFGTSACTKTFYSILVFQNCPNSQKKITIKRSKFSKSQTFLIRWKMISSRVISKHIKWAINVLIKKAEVLIISSHLIQLKIQFHIWIFWNFQWEHKIWKELEKTFARFWILGEVCVSW